MCREIILTQGKTAIVDAQDFERLSAVKWYAAYCRNRWYAVRNKRLEDGTRKTIFLHGEVLKVPKGMKTDHINGDSLDCRRANLRPLTHTANMMNRPKQRNNSSGYKGVYRKGNKWSAVLNVRRKSHYLGIFAKATDAAKAYDKYASKLHGDAAWLNFR